MALINCPECEAKISSNAKSCPQCGQPICCDDESDNGVQTIEQTSKEYKLRQIYSSLLLIFGILLLFVGRGGGLSIFGIIVIFVAIVWSIIIGIFSWWDHG